MIAETLQVVTRVAASHLDDYEIIVVDDGSTDGTGDRALAAAEVLPKITVHRQPVSMGVGAAYLEGLKRASFPYITVVPGDNAFTETALNNVFSAVGTAELVVSYRDNMEVRTPVRRVLSILCTALMRLSTGCAIRDAHSMFVYPVALARDINVQPGYGYHIESLGRQLVLLSSFVEVPAPLNPRPDASSGVMKVSVVALLGFTMIKLMLWRVANSMKLSRVGRSEGSNRVFNAESR